MPSAGYITDANGIPVGTTQSTVLNQASAAQTTSGNSGPLSTASVQSLAVDVNVTAITGGTAPTIQFYVDRQGADGIWYRVWTGTALTATGVSSTSIGLGAPTNAVLTSTCRFGWIFGGTVNATSITFSASVVGR